MEVLKFQQIDLNIFRKKIRNWVIGISSILVLIIGMFIGSSYVEDTTRYNAIGSGVVAAVSASMVSIINSRNRKLSRR
jgi:hypothetical protein